MAAMNIDNRRGDDRAMQRGFNLLELMIVIVVVSILARIAISSYTEQVHKSRRANAYNNVGQVQVGLERWRAENPCYAPAWVASTNCSSTYTANGTFPFPSATTPITSDSYYTYAVTYSTSQPYYTVTATPKSGTAQANDRCSTLCAYAPGATASTTCGTAKPLWSTTSCN